MTIEPKSTKKVSETFTIELSGQDIIQLLADSGVDVPSRANVCVVVPISMDRGDDLDITTEAPVTIEWSVSYNA